MCQEEWNWFKILSVKQCGMQCLTPFTETRLLRKQENLFFKRMCVLKISASYFLRRKKKKSVVNELLFGTGNSIWTSFLPEWGLQLGHRDDLTLEQLSCSQLLLSPGSRWGHSSDFTDAPAEVQGRRPGSRGAVEHPCCPQRQSPRVPSCPAEAGTLHRVQN